MYRVMIEEGELSGRVLPADYGSREQLMRLFIHRKFDAKGRLVAREDVSAFIGNGKVYPIWVGEPLGEEDEDVPLLPS